jgi:hypothetical protein
VFDAVDEALWRLVLEFDGLVFVLFDFSRGVEVRLAILAATTVLMATALALFALLWATLFLWFLAFLGGGLFFGQTFGRKTGGDILGAFDFLFVPFAVEERVRGFLAGDFGASFGGAAVWLLLLLLLEAAAWAKTHSTATAA